MLISYPHLLHAPLGHDQSHADPDTWHAVVVYYIFLDIAANAQQLYRLHDLNI